MSVFSFVNQTLYLNFTNSTDNDLKLQQVGDKGCGPWDLCL